MLGRCKMTSPASPNSRMIRVFIKFQSQIYAAIHCTLSEILNTEPDVVAAIDPKIEFCRFSSHISQDTAGGEGSHDLPQL
jgi:hypothetical protein